MQWTIRHVHRLRPKPFYHCCGQRWPFLVSFMQSSAIDVYELLDFWAVWPRAPDVFYGCRVSKSKWLAIKLIQVRRADINQFNPLIKHFILILILILIYQWFLLRWSIALAMVAGLFGAVLGSTHPIAAVLVCGFAGAITSGSIITFCIATLPNHVFGVSTLANERWIMNKYSKHAISFVYIIIVFSYAKLLLQSVAEL